MTVRRRACHPELSALILKLNYQTASAVTRKRRYNYWSSGRTWTLNNRDAQSFLSIIATELYDDSRSCGESLIAAESREAVVRWCWRNLTVVIRGEPERFRAITGYLEKRGGSENILEAYAAYSSCKREGGWKKNQQKWMADSSRPCTGKPRTYKK